MNVSVVQIAVVILAGLVGGFVNTFAGGGSFLTLAALQMAGLPMVMANGTNRIALVAQNAAAVAGFRSKGYVDWRLSLSLGIPALVGAVVGAYLVIDLDEAIFSRILAVAMLVMLLILIFRPEKRIKPRDIQSNWRSRLVTIVVMFAIGLYGGAIQAGVGLLSIAALVLITGLDLVKINSLKVFIIGAFSVVALLTFALRGQVDWVLGAVMAVGNSVGGWLASRLQVAKGPALVRWVL
ncbi:MAG: sulfite exporter TauE/SafE family protein, partial [Chloroflexota bacterium]